MDEIQVAIKPEEREVAPQRKGYEFSFLVKDENSAGEIISMLKKRDLEIVFEGQLRKINLAYPIEKENQASFGYFHLKAAPSELRKIEEEIAGSNLALRTLVVSLPSKGGDRVPSVAGPVSRWPRGGRVATRARRRVVTNEALEKKIEEISQ